MDKTQLCFAVFLLWALLCPSHQYVRTITCFDRICPAGTDNCKMNRKSTIDRKKIENIVYCLNPSGASLREYYFDEASNLSPRTYYQDTTYASINIIQSSQ
ncbi:uncharacterized protein LOC143197902 isoform X2 [Rhynchophorus ferrugineus]|uniref:uncharacterized protein LOC143197902 isoform X2 n=1 Tax=Rhynchophorus ferrugineus TaxID=354439 RepID=UPI003FCCE612